MIVKCPHCKGEIEISPASLLGQQTSVKKAASSAKNGMLGGRPKASDEEFLARCQAIIEKSGILNTRQVRRLKELAEHENAKAAELLAARKND